MSELDTLHTGRTNDSLATREVGYYVDELESLQQTVDMLAAGLRDSEAEKMRLTAQLEGAQAGLGRMAALAERVAQLEGENSRLHDQLNAIAEGAAASSAVPDLGDAGVEVEGAAQTMLAYKSRFANERNARARRELELVAREEKLSTALAYRTRQLIHVSELLASTENRNIEIAALIGRVCSAGLTMPSASSAPAGGKPPAATGFRLRLPGAAKPTTAIDRSRTAKPRWNG